MMKQQPCASKLRLSKICRLLIALGIAKLALFGAWSVDMPLPQLVSPGKNLASPPEPAIAAVPGRNASADAPASPANTPGQPPASSSSAKTPGQPPTDAVEQSSPARNTGEVRLAVLFAERDKPAEPKAPAAPPHSPPAITPLPPLPPEAKPVTGFGELAVRSAAPLPSMPEIHLPWSKAARAEAEAASAGNDGARPLVSGVDAGRTPPFAVRETPVSNDSWWREIVTLTRLPVPVLGVRQIAHAAALDMPPPTVRPSAPGASPFTPPEQAQVRPAAPAGQGAHEPPLPLRPRVAASQNGAGTSTLPVPLVQNGLSAEAPERKQQELARREQDVLMLKQQMESRLQELQSAEKKVQGMLREAHGVHDQKIKHLISAYTSMKPKQAALALESLDERLAVRILAGMNPKQAGEVLTYTNPQKVAKLSELLARMQIPGE